MIGFGLKKLAKEHEMMISSGVAYGNMNGFQVTLSEGMGTKTICFSTTFPDEEKRTELQKKLRLINLSRDYRIRELTFEPRQIRIVFRDDPGTMTMIRAFLRKLMELLREYGATGAGICPVCGGAVSGGKWVLLDDCASYVHASCANTLFRNAEITKDNQKADRSSLIAFGVLGALVGALVGGAVWGIMLSLGVVASAVGILIGFLAEFGYRKLGGEKGWIKIVVVLSATVLGAFVGTVGRYAWIFAQLIMSGQTGNYSFGDIPYMMITVLSQSQEAMGLFLRESIGGTVLGEIGVAIAMLRQGKQRDNTKVKNLE